MLNPGRFFRKRLLSSARRERLSSVVYASMVDSLYGTLVGYAALTGTSVLLAVVTFIEQPNNITGSLLLAMLVLAIGRIALIVGYHRWSRSKLHRVRDIARWEARYTLLGILLTGTIGLTCGYTVRAGASSLSLVISVVVVMGITGCIAGRNGSRPNIVKYQIMTMFMPFIGALLLRGTTEAWSIAALIVVYHLALMSSTHAVYATLRNALSSHAKIGELSRRVQRSADLFDTALNNMTSGLLYFDKRQRLVVANDRVKSAMGRELVEASIGAPLDTFCSALFSEYQATPAEADAVRDALERTIDTGSAGSLSFVDHGRNRVYELRVQSIPDQGAVINVDDVTEKRNKDRVIRHLAHHDGLTDLPNRVSLGLYLERILQGLTEVIVMYLDLDHFKDVNDELGHGAGDMVLKEVAERLTTCVGADAGAFVSRISGDEFVIVLQPSTPKAEAIRLAEAIIARLSMPYEVADRILTLGASIGMTITGPHTPTSLEALRTADVALYEAKASGRGIAVWFDPSMDERARGRREMMAFLRQAVADDGLHMAYQPIVDARTGRIVTFEALCRWTHPVLGHVAPSVFIPLAEESDLIIRLGQFVLRRACEDAARWPSSIKVAINISAAQFRSGSVADHVLRILHETGFAANRLEVEVTESVLVHDIEAVRRELVRLHDAGVTIALDDFGTGFSSLQYIHELPIDKIKLDRSFTSRLVRDQSALRLVASIVQLTKTLGKDLVIEGVETAADLESILSVDGRLIQGYFFSRPILPAEVPALLTRFDTIDARASESIRLSA